jgi:hypothetical protein
MAKHIHIWLRGSTRDADGPAHVPAGSSKGGQFTSGSGGGGGSAKKVVPGHSATANKSAKEQPKNLVNRATPAMQKEAAERKANGGGSKADVAGFMSRVAKKTPSPAPSSKAPAGSVNQSSGPDEDKLRARVKAARAGMQAAGKNKAEYERHEQQFESSMEALTTLQEKNKAAGKK